MQYIEKLYLDKAFYKKISCKMKKRIMEMCSEDSIQSMINSIHECYNAFIKNRT